MSEKAWGSVKTRAKSGTYSRRTWRVNLEKDNYPQKGGKRDGSKKKGQRG